MILNRAENKIWFEPYVPSFRGLLEYLVALDLFTYVSVLALVVIRDRFDAGQVLGVLAQHLDVVLHLLQVFLDSLVGLLADFRRHLSYRLEEQLLQVFIADGVIGFQEVHVVQLDAGVHQVGLFTSLRELHAEVGNLVGDQAGVDEDLPVWITCVRRDRACEVTSKLPLRLRWDRTHSACSS